MANTNFPNSLQQKVPSVNFHLWEPCNMRCRFCFATFQDVKRDMQLPKGHLPEKDSIMVVEKLAEAGFEKINFAGGEPILCPWLPGLIRLAKVHGMVTSIVTNGSGISPQWLDSVNGCLDWIALSIDTIDPEKLIRIGRAVSGKVPITPEEYRRMAGDIKRRGIRLKVNTVVTSATWKEDFSGFIRLLKPERWKMFQVLRVNGQNDRHIADYSVSAERFDAYVQRNCIVEQENITVVPENNRLMTKSYVMVDPAGRFFDNAKGAYTYSDPILEVGIHAALKTVSIDPDRFLLRRGKYDW